MVTLDEIVQPLMLGEVCATGEKLGNVHGHVNWFPVTVTGALVWDSFSAGWQDHDVNFGLFPATSNALTSGNGPPHGYRTRQPAYHLEMYNEETLARVPGGARGFWKALRNNVDDSRTASRLVSGRFAIVTGLFGVDGVHNFQAELHPIYAMAILLAAENERGSTVEHWAVMVRNTGSEGDCGTGTIPMLIAPPTDSLQEFSFDLGHWPDAGVPAVTLDGGASSLVSDTIATLRATFQRADSDSARHLFLHVGHRRPRPGDADFLFLGSFTITWPQRGAKAWAIRARFGQNAVPPYADTSAMVPVNTHALTTRLPLSEIVGTRSQAQKTFPVPAALEAAALPPAELDSLLVLPTDTLTVDTGALGVTIPRPLIHVYPVAAWPLPTSVQAYCVRSHDGKRLEDTGPACHSPWRWGPAITSSNGTLAPSLSLYLFPHATTPTAEGPGGLAEAIFAGLGYRVDVREDRFRPIRQEGDAIARYGQIRRGLSVHLATTLSPNTYRFGSSITMSPYTIANIGASWMKKQTDPRPTWGWGVGAQFEVGHQDWFIEGQTTARAGGFVNRWIYALGWLIPLEKRIDRTLPAR